MNKRQALLLTYMVNSSEYEPIEAIAEHFSVSSKTIRRDLGALEDEITLAGGVLEYKRGSGVKLLASHQVINKLKDSSERGKWSNQDRKERHYLLSLFLLLSNLDSVSFKQLCNIFYISRSQVILDIKTIQDIFKPFGVSIEARSGGVRVVGADKDINDLTSYLISQYLDYGFPEEKVFYPSKIEKAELIVEPLLGNADKEFINHIIGLISNTATKKIWKQDLGILISGLLVFLKRKKGEQETQVARENQPYPNREFLNLTLSICEKIEEFFKLELSYEDAATINNTILGTGLVHDPAFSSSDRVMDYQRKLIRDFSEDFVDAFSTITDIDLRANKTFYSRIHEHIEPMINRVLINLAITDRFLDLYSEEYRNTMNVCEVICWILSQKYSLPEIPRAEVLFLMLYIQTEIIEAEEKLNIGFVSHDDKSVLHLQLTRIAKEFPSFCISHYDQLSKNIFFKDNLDLAIVTKGSELETGLPAVEVSTRITNLDLRIIRSFVETLVRDMGREETILKNTIRDLIDLGCDISFDLEVLQEFPQERDMLRVEGVNNSLFVYLDKGKGLNTLRIRCPRSSDEKFVFIFDMNNWDFLLFASKIIYLIDRITDTNLCNLIESTVCTVKESNV